MARSCGMREQTTEHMLQHCLEYGELKKECTPTEVTLNYKLYGTREKLQMIAGTIMEPNWQDIQNDVIERGRMASKLHNLFCFPTDYTC